VLAAVSATSDGPPERRFIGVAALGAAGPEDISFCNSERHAAALAATRAGAVVMAPGVGEPPPGCIAIRVRNPSLAFARIAELFHPRPHQPARHPTAVIDPRAQLAPDVAVGPYAVVGAGAEIGPGSSIGAHAVVGPGVVLGARCVLHPHACITNAICGDDVVLHAGARVGQEGFGFVPDERGDYVTMPQLGRVLLGSGVHVGANACVDRGALDDTVLGPGTRIDNLVQVGHNTVTGVGCIMAGQVGLSGSVTLEDRVTLGGQVGVADHIRVGRGARVAAQSGIMVDVPPGAEMLGSPAQPIKAAMRGIATLRRLADAGRKTRQDKS
jgi:UDP-3-O-[3-hydroxymyristoyl] glucosamine N-acyltransferase